MAPIRKQVLVVGGSIILLSGCGSNSTSAAGTAQAERVPSLPPLLSTSERPETHWRLVNAAPVIVRATVDGGEDRGVTEPEGYRAQGVMVLEVLKGSDLLPPAGVPTPPVRSGGRSRLDLLGYPTEDSWSALKRHRGKTVLLFLQFGGKGTVPGGVYLVGGNPFAIQHYTPSLEATLKAEIKHQEGLASAVQTLLASRVFRQEAQIRKLVSRLLETRTYKRDKDAFPPKDANGEPKLSSFPPPIAALEALGEDAIPGLVKSLDDQRSLPGGRVHITLDISKRPHAFEGLYHTTASEVRDTLAMVLDQITQDGIGSPNSDSLACGRNGIMAGWRLYLGHSEKWRRVLESGADSPGNPRKVPGKVAGQGGGS